MDHRHLRIQNKWDLFCIPLGLHYLWWKPKAGGTSEGKEKTSSFSLSFARFALPLDKGRRHLGNKNKWDLFCIPLGLHYLWWKPKLGGTSEIKINGIYFVFRSVCTTFVSEKRKKREKH
jgi:hypothetical protein